MNDSRETVVLVVAGVLAFVLQFVLAPSIALGNAMPNFVVVFTFVCAIQRFQTFGCVMPFLLGLLFDFLSGSVVGAMAFSLTLFSVVSARVFYALNNDTLFVPFVVMGLGFVFVESAYGAVLLASGYNAGLLEALVFQALPCALYDFVVAALLYPLATRFLKGNTPASPIMTTQLR